MRGCGSSFWIRALPCCLLCCQILSPWWRQGREEIRGDLRRQGGPSRPECRRGGGEKRGSGSGKACGKRVDIDVWGGRGGCRSCLRPVTPGHQCPVYVPNEKPPEGGSWVC